MLEKIAAFLEKEWDVLKKAPFVFITLSVLCLSVGYAIGMLYFDSQVASLHEELNAKDGQIGRYRVALGIDPGSSGALVELNNQELALRAQTIVLKLREMNRDLNYKLGLIQPQIPAGKMKPGQTAKFVKQQMDIMTEVSQDFRPKSRVRRAEHRE